MKLAEVSIRRPVFALMLILGLVVLGLVSLERLELQLDPTVEFPRVTVTTQLRGASPETMEMEVSDILEEEINSIEGIDVLRSTSSDGLSEIVVQFDLEYDADQKVQEVRDKVALARPRLPRDVEEPRVTKYDFNSVPIMAIMVGGPVSLRELSDLAEHRIQERIERLPGVGGVILSGSRKREIRVWVDPLRLTGYGLSIEDVAGVLRRENAELAGGRIESRELEWSVTTQGKVRRVEDFGELIVAQRGDRLVRLRDVAVVEDGLAEERSIARLSGKRGVALEVQRQSGANVVSVAREVRAEIERIRPVLPPGVEMRIAHDYALYVEQSIHDVFIDMLISGVLVVVVVLIFLRNRSSTFISALAIPSSVIASFTFFYLADFTLNSMTLMALSLSVGLVIDDAIVVLESIYRRLEAGKDPRRAANEGASEVGLAVLSTTLAVCAVFVPIAFMESTVGRYFYEFGLVVVIAVSVSALVSFTLTPMLASRILRPASRPGPVFRILARALDALERGYRRLLAGALRHKGVTTSVALAAIAGGCGIASTLPFDFYTASDMNEIRVKAKFPIGSPLPVTDRLMGRMEESLLQHPAVVDVFATAGGEIRRTPNRASILVLLRPKTERPPITRLFDELRARLRDVVPEAEELSVGNAGYAGAAPGEAEYSLRGPDLGRLARYANLLMARMRADPEFADVSSSLETGRPQITLEIERGRAADLGVPAVAIGQTIRTLLAGEKVGSFEDGGRRYDVRMQVLPEYRDDPSRLDLIRVRSLRGELVPLTNAAHARIDEGPVKILRENRARQISVAANLAGGVPLGDATRKIEAWGRELGIAAPDELVPSGHAKAMQETGRGIVFAFGLALAAIYMILASLFNSLSHPFTIMVSAPLSFIGGFLALAIAGMPLDMMSGIGLLVLMGLVMKNGILLVDYTNQLRERGRSRDQALLEAGPVRMRPVLMTSGALIMGMLPVVLTNSIGSEFRAPMGMITIGGLLTSTLLTLVVVPVVYALVDSATEWSRRAVGRALRRPGPAPTRAR